MIDHGITSACARGHTQKIRLADTYGKREAETLAGIIDGRSAAYKYQPREYPFTTYPEKGSHVGLCQECAAWIDCTLFGYDEA